MADCTQEADSTDELAFGGWKVTGVRETRYPILAELVQPERILYKLAGVKQMFIQEGTETAD